MGLSFLVFLARIVGMRGIWVGHSGVKHAILQDRCRQGIKRLGCWSLTGTRTQKGTNDSQAQLQQGCEFIYHPSGFTMRPA